LQSQNLISNNDRCIAFLSSVLATMDPHTLQVIMLQWSVSQDLSIFYNLISTRKKTKKQCMC